MNGSIQNQVYDVLHKYDKSYNTSGVNCNLEKWKHNKGWLVELLRRHPNWNEEAMAVIFEVTQSREIDRNTVFDYKCALGNLIHELDISEDEKSKFLRSLDAVAYTYSNKLPDTNTVALIKETCGVSCVPGQKSSRVVNAICKQFGVDKHPEYNARFARLADSLNPLQIKRTALLSVHPCDYLEMSNRDNSWRSCHCLDDGEHHGGTLSLMNDTSTMIFYTVDESVTEDFHTAPKRTRQVFSFSNGILLQSRLYPQSDDDDTRDMYRNIVQIALADCLAVPNLWMLKQDHESVTHHINTHHDALQYPDYQYKENKSNVSLLQDSDNGDDDYILVGFTAYCLDCSEVVDESRHMYCDSCCEDTVWCKECDSSVHERDSYYINGYSYCTECCSHCDHCRENQVSDMTPVSNIHGYRIHVCDSCRDEDYYYCESCDGYYHRDTVYRIDDDYYCNDCYEKEYCTCDICGEDVPINDIETTDGSYYCEDCAISANEEMEEVKAGVCVMSA